MHYTTSDPFFPDLAVCATQKLGERLRRKGEGDQLCGIAFDFLWIFQRIVGQVVGVGILLLPVEVEHAQRDRLLQDNIGAPGDGALSVAGGSGQRPYLWLDALDGAKVVHRQPADLVGVWVGTAEDTTGAGGLVDIS